MTSLPMRTAVLERSLRPLLFHALTPLLLGGVIYIAWRSRTLLMFRWFEIVGVDVQPTRDALSEFAPTSDVVLFSLPNALWAYALVSFFCIVWHEQPGTTARLWIAAACTLAVAPEIGQSLGFISGTFDRLDLLTASAAVCAALSQHRRFRLVGNPHVATAA